MLEKISDLHKIIEKQKVTRRLALAVAQDLHSLGAVQEAHSKGIIVPVLIGDKEKIHETAEKIAFDVSNIEIIHETNRELAVEKAVRMVHDEKADILMKGYVGTSVLMKAVLNRTWGLRKGKLLSHIALFEVDAYHKLLALTDVAMNISPDLQDKIAILNNAVSCLNRVDIINPKVAILGAVEMVYENMQATLDAALISKMAQRGQIQNCIVDGPLAFDNVVSADSAQHKGIASEVAGDSDLLLLPNIETGNVLYKALVFFAKAKLAAIILGASAPIVLTSRSDSEEAKYNSILLAAATG